MAKQRTTTVNIVYDVTTDKLERGNVLLEKASKSTDKLRGEAVKAGTALKTAGDDGVKSFLSFNNVIKGLSFAALTAGIISITRKIFALGVAQEQTNIAFNTLVGNTEKAKKLLAELMKFSIATPFTPDQVNKAAKTLLAFGVVAEDILPTLKFLGDVSSGTGKDLAEMAVIFGQIRSTGRLMGQDLLQLINAGFNPLQIISQKTGKTMIELKRDMEAGLISFDMVKDAFKSATSEGGLFFNLMEKQSKSIGGKLSTIEGNIDEIAKRLFEARAGGMSDFADGVVELTGHINELAAAINLWISGVTFVPRMTLKAINAVSDAMGDDSEEFEEMQKRRRQIWEDTIKAQKDDVKEVVVAIGLIQALEEKIKSLQNAIKASTDKSELGVGGTLVKQLKTAQDELDKLLGKSPEGKKAERKKELNEVQDFLASLSELEMFNTKALLKDKAEQRKNDVDNEKENLQRSADLQEYFRDLRSQKEKEAADEAIVIAEDTAAQKRAIEEQYTMAAFMLARSLVDFAFTSRQSDISGIQDFYNEQIQLAGDNERAREELAVKRDRAVEKAREKDKQAEKKQAVARIIAETAVNIVQAFPNYILMAVAASLGIIQAATVRRLRGGAIDLQGPGTETSDSIPAMLSRRESVMTADETKSSMGILKAVRAKKLNDKMLQEIVAGRSGGSTGVAFDDRRILKKLDEVKNSNTDIVQKGKVFFKIKEKNDSYTKMMRLYTIGKF